MKKKYAPPKKKQTLAQRITRDQDIRKIVEERMERDAKIRIRMGWAYLIAMAETPGVELTPEQINDVVKTMDDTMSEYHQIEKEDGSEVADAKLYRKICQIMGEDSCDYQFERILEPTTIDTK